MKVLYAPPPLFGLIKVAPVEVEVLENPVPSKVGLALIRIQISSEALINILAGVERKPRVIERLVLASDLKPL
jgi:hypothetical protein